MISAANPMEFNMDSDTVSRTVNVTFDNGKKCVSLSLDNSGGRMSTLKRGTIRLFVGPLDVTGRVFNGADRCDVHSTLENFEEAMKWLRRTEWGFSGAL